MTAATHRPALRPLLTRAVVYLVGMYALLIGGTFTGVTVSRLQRLSLAVLSVAVLAWLASVWHAQKNARAGAPFGPLFAAWGVAFALSAIGAPSGRSTIALWFMALYAGVWLLLSDLRQRGIGGTVFSDLLVISALPLVYWALAQALPWFPRWWASRDLGVPFFPARPVSTLGNPNLLGALLAMALPFGLARLLTLPDRLGRGLMVVWLAVVLATLYLTYSRGAWLGAVAGSVALAVIATAHQFRPRPFRGSLQFGSRTRLRAIVVIAAAALAVVLLAASLAGQAFDSPQRETGARLRYYALALERFAGQPLTGTGLFTFGRELSAAESIPPAQPHAHAHNLVLNVAAELGVPGLVALALTVAWIARAVWRGLRAADSRQARLQAAASAAALTAISVHSLVDMPLMTPSLTLAALAALAAGVAPLAPEADSSPARRWIARLGVTAFWVAVLAAGWRGAHSSERYERGLSLVAAGDYQAAMGDLGAAADARPDNALYRAEYAYAAALGAGQGDPGAAGKAAVAYQQALADEPDQALWWANLAAVQWGKGEQADALRAMGRSVAAAPEAADLWLNLGRYSELAGDRWSALRAYRRALQLAPRLSAALYWGETPLRRVALATSANGLFPESAARRLWIAGEEEEAMAWLHRTITRDPTQARPYVEIARLALESGQVERAEAYLDAADVLGPLGADAAWIALLRAEIAATRGDEAQAEALRVHAEAMVTPDQTGHRLMYGADIAQFQFLSLTVPGKLLPDLVMLGPEPAVVQAALNAQ